MASWLDLVFGQKPKYAPFKKTDPLKELSTLLGGEITSWPQIENLSNLYQTYMLGAMNQAIPGFTGIMDQMGVDTKALATEADPLIHGEIPQDVVDQVFRSSAMTSLMAGTAGGPMGAALSARDLGLTSLDLMSQGSNLLGQAGNVGNAIQRWASGTILPPSANLYSPEWFSTFQAQQQAAQQASKQLKYNLAAAPDPAAAGISGTLMNLLGAYLGSVGGGKMGGMGGGGGGGGGITPSYGSVMGSVIGDTSNFLGGGYGPYSGQMPTLAANYGAAGMPVTFGESGYPAAIPVNVSAAQSAAPPAVATNPSSNPWFNYAL